MLANQTSRRGKFAARFTSKHGSSAIVKALKRKRVYSFFEVVFGLAGPLFVTIACHYVGVPQDRSVLTEFQLFLYDNHLLIISFIAIMIFVTFVIIKSIYSNLCEILRTNEIMNSDALIEMRYDMQTINAFINLLCKKIGSGETNLRNMCDLMCTAIFQRLEHKNQLSVNIYHYNFKNDEVWMPGHYDNRNAWDGKNPSLYTCGERSKKKITDDGIYQRFMAKCLLRELNSVNCLTTQNEIHANFHFDGISDRGKKRYSQYINIVSPDIDENIRFMIEVVSFDGSLINPKKDLPAVAENLLGPLACLFPLMHSVSHQGLSE